MGMQAWVCVWLSQTILDEDVRNWISSWDFYGQPQNNKKSSEQFSCFCLNFWLVFIFLSCDTHWSYNNSHSETSPSAVLCLWQVKAVTCSHLDIFLLSFNSHCCSVQMFIVEVELKAFSSSVWVIIIEISFNRNFASCLKLTHKGKCKQICSFLIEFLFDAYLVEYRCHARSNFLLIQPLMSSNRIFWSIFMLVRHP